MGTRVTAAHFNEANGLWEVETDQGDRGDPVTAHYPITAIGCISAAQMPSVPGLETFAGEWYHTGDWPHDGVDFAGKRVGVIGTGSSGVQAIPVIARSRKIQANTPLGRAQTPEDIANLAVFLASDLSLNITSQAINVNGGSRMD